MNKYLISGFYAMLMITSLTAQQFDVSAELRPRLENTHGYKTLMPSDADGNSFISQRTRLNVNFEQKKIKLGISLQNVRVWGDVSTLAAKDNNFAFHEAWAEALLSDNFSLKFGRQEIIYDDSRIFGNVGWAQQGRSHDAIIAKFKLSSNNQLDVGFALNEDGQAELNTLYSNVAGYKAFQYAWYHSHKNKLGFSLLVLNNGVEYELSQAQETDYSQTMGTRISFTESDFSGDFSTYYQGGKLRNSKVDASYFGANLKYKASSELTVGIGAELLSGKDMNDTSDKIKSFAPLFGTNHKFNGWMDYFYVGNHGGSVGLFDLNAVIAYKKDKFSLTFMPHIFTSAADVYSGTSKMDNNLGTELDFNFGYKIANDIQVNAGYSVLFATESMEVLKGGDSDANNYWAWLMVTIKPSLFSSK